LLGNWCDEETWSQFSSKYDLFRGSHFSIEILVTDIEFLLSVNGKHFGAYNHRIPYKKINSIEVKGDVKEVQIDQLFRDKYPEVPTEAIPSAEPVLAADDKHKFMAVPFMAKISGGFTRNKSLHIHGKVKLLPHSITINLQQSSHFWPHPVIPLHINPRFSNQGGKHVVCRNSWVNGKWLKEERTELQAKDLSPGKFFTMVIECQFDSFLIYVNEKFFAEFRFRTETIVDAVNIFGDVCLTKVWVESKKFD